MPRPSAARPRRWSSRRRRPPESSAPAKGVPVLYVTARNGGLGPGLLRRASPPRWRRRSPSMRSAPGSRRTPRRSTANPAAWCAVELALLDALGRTAGVPLEPLVGLTPLDGVFRYSAVLGDMAPEAFGQLAARYHAMGLRDFKVKLSGDLARDRAKLAALARARGPGPRPRRCQQPVARGRRRGGLPRRAGDPAVRRRGAVGAGRTQSRSGATGRSAGHADHRRRERDDCRRGGRAAAAGGALDCQPAGLEDGRHPAVARGGRRRPAPPASA